MTPAAAVTATPQPATVAADTGTADNASAANATNGTAGEVRFETGAVSGIVTNERNEPITNAVVYVGEFVSQNGTTFTVEPVGSVREANRTAVLESEFTVTNTSSGDNVTVTGAQLRRYDIDSAAADGLSNVSLSEADNVTLLTFAQRDQGQAQYTLPRVPAQDPDGVSYERLVATQLDSSPQTTVDASEPVRVGFASEANVVISGATPPDESTNETGTISGQVLDSESNALAGAAVTVENASGAVVAETTAFDNGGYNVEVPPGEYTVIAESDGVTGERTATVAAGVTNSTNVVVPVSEPSDTERQLGATAVEPGGEVTVTVRTDVETDRVSITERFSPAVEAVSIDSVTVDGETTRPVVGVADASAVTVALGGTEAGETVTVRYTVTVPETAENGTTYTISGAVTDEETTSIGNETVTVREDPPLSLAVREYDTDDDGEIDAEELGQAGDDFAAGEISADVLGQVGQAFADA